MVQHDLIGEVDPLFVYREASASDRLMSILQNRIIHASPMPFLPTAHRAVCFTECIWEGLNHLADQYSPYGVVFSKRLIFDFGGGPALYLRGDMLGALESRIPKEIYPFIAPFDPEATLKPGVRLDWLQEREWRLPDSLQFEYANVEYVLVESIGDATNLVHQIGAQHLPENKVIPMEVYRNIKSTWRDDRNGNFLESNLSHSTACPMERPESTNPAAQVPTSAQLGKRCSFLFGRHHCAGTSHAKSLYQKGCQSENQAHGI